MTKRRSKRKNYSKRKPITHRKKKGSRLVGRRTRHRKSYRSRRYKGSRGRGGGKGRRDSSNPPQGKIKKTPRSSASRPDAAASRSSTSQKTFRRPQPVISAGTGGKAPVLSAPARAAMGERGVGTPGGSGKWGGKPASAGDPLAAPPSPAGDSDKY